KTAHVRSTRWIAVTLVTATPSGACSTRTIFSCAPVSKIGDGFSRIPTTTRWWTSLKEGSAHIAFAGRAYLSGATRATRSPATAGGTGFPTKIIETRFSHRCDDGG